MSKPILSAEGMHCPSCIEHISEVLNLHGVVRIDVRFEESAVAVEHDPAVSAGRLVAALKQAGYDATPRS